LPGITVVNIVKKKMIQITINATDMIFDLPAHAALAINTLDVPPRHA